MEEDARGIIDPRTGLTRFRLDRYAPSEGAARFVDRYWVASWDLEEPFVQRVLPHPVVNLVFADGRAAVHGPATEVGRHRLEGRGWALGVMFRPAGFRPFLGRPMNEITDAVLEPGELFEDFGELLAAAPGIDSRGTDTAPLRHAVDRFLSARAPVRRDPAEDTRGIVERVAADPAVTSVAALAAREGMSARLLQRRFSDHVGIGPKAVIRRYRFYEAAERARRGAPPDWARLAADLGFSDQSHLTREFTAVIGVPPARYAAEGAPGA